MTIDPRLGNRPPTSWPQPGVQPPPLFHVEYVGLMVGCGLRFPAGVPVDLVKVWGQPGAAAQWWFRQNPTCEILLLELPNGAQVEYRRGREVRRSMILPRLGWRRRLRRWVRRLLLGNRR